MTPVSEAQLQTLRTIANRATDADLSILHAALAESGGTQPTMLTTTPGSNNDSLWSTMAELGWMSVSEPLEVPVATRVFIINPTAREAIRSFLADRRHADAMTKILNDMRTNIPPVLIQAVQGVEGTPADLAILLGTIVTSTMRRAIKPELHDEFLREVARVAEGMRSV